MSLRVRGGMAGGGGGIGLMVREGRVRGWGSGVGLRGGDGAGAWARGRGAGLGEGAGVAEGCGGGAGREGGGGLRRRRVAGGMLECWSEGEEVSSDRLAVKLNWGLGRARGLGFGFGRGRVADELDGRACTDIRLSTADDRRHQALGPTSMSSNESPSSHCFDRNGLERERSTSGELDRLLGSSRVRSSADRTIPHTK